MKLTQKQFNGVADSFPRERGIVSPINLQPINAPHYVVEHGCK
jgi:hypothetical protein